MSRSLSFLRRGFLAVAIVASLGFGATQALAAPDRAARYGSCELTGYGYFPERGCAECQFISGYCDGFSEDCLCF